MLFRSMDVCVHLRHAKDIHSPADASAYIHVTGHKGRQKQGEQVASGKASSLSKFHVQVIEYMVRVRILNPDQFYPVYINPAI